MTETPPAAATGAPSLAARLREATSAAHRHAETRPLQRLLVQGRLPARALTAYLGQLLLVHQALESAVDRCAAAGASWSVLLDDGARHSRRLRRDVSDRGADPSQVAARPATAALLGTITEAERSCPPRLLGMLYVLEGSMNGNRFISRALAQGAAKGSPFTYFDPYGAEQAARWSAFRGALDAAGGAIDDHGPVVDGALAMFDGVAAISDDVSAAA